MRKNGTSIGPNALRRGRGYSLMELAMVLAVIALIIAGVMLFFEDASDKRRHNDLLSEINLIVLTAHQAYSGTSGGYANLSSALIVGTNNIPNKWVSSTGGINDPWGHPILLTQGVVNGTVPNVPTSSVFSMTLNGVSANECIRLATAEYGTNLVGFQVYGSWTLQDGGISPVSATMACNTGLSSSGGQIYLLWY